MALQHYLWSRTAGSNANADPAVNWAEGQSPSSVNDSARAMMASAAGFRDDISGAIATGGTSTAYTVTSYQVFNSLANMNGQIIAFTPHATNGATVTLNVDGLGAKPLRSSPGVELPAGVLVQGTPYAALYNSSDAAFYLHGFFDNPYNIPVAGSIEYWGTTSPDSSLVFPYGQAINRTTYATAFSRMGTAYGVGDGSTTFNLPDCRGRVVAGKDDMGGVSANRLGGGVITGNTLGAAAGSDVVALSGSQLPAHTHSGNTGTESNFHTHNVNDANAKTGTSPGGGAFFNMWTGSPIVVASSSNNQPHTHPFTTDGGSGLAGDAHMNIQPTIVANKLIRII